jgi:hypothetical protein
MAATVIFGMLRRQLMLLTALAAGALLVCDARFDLMTAGALRLIRLSAIRMWLLDPKTPLWRPPLLP